MKYILVTGAYGGMGRKTVNLLKKQGYCVFALDRKVEEEEENVIPLQADVTDEESIKKAYQKVKDVTEKLYAIVHFAGIYMLDSLVEIERENFIHLFEVNLFGAFLINKIFIPLLKKDSRIVITTSELAPLDPLPFTGIYAVTKGALDKYAYSLSMELQLLDIKVSVIRAGAIDTGMLNDSTEALDKFCKKTQIYTYNADRFKKIVDGVEAKRVSPQKLAQKVLKILNIRKPRFAYNINRNLLLLLLAAFPKKFQLWIIKLILT